MRGANGEGISVSGRLDQCASMEKIERLATAEAQYDVVAGPINHISGKMLGAVLNEWDAPIFAEAGKLGGTVAEAQKIDGDDGNGVARKPGAE
jgi:hypothetical protein